MPLKSLLYPPLAIFLSLLAFTLTATLFEHGLGIKDDAFIDKVTKPVPSGC